MDRPDHVQPAHRSRRVFVFDFFLVLATTIIGLGDARLDPLPPLPADPRRVRAAARPRALLHASRSSPTRGDDPQRGGGRAAAQQRRAPPDGRADADRDPPVRGRPPPAGRPARHDRADRPGHPLRRRAASSPSSPSPAAARIEPHTNPNTTWFIVDRGRRLGRCRRRADPRSRPARRSSGRPTSRTRAWTEHSEMRAFVVEFAGADDAASRPSLEGRAAGAPRDGRRRPGPTASLAPRDRAGGPRPDGGRAGLTRRAGSRAGAAPPGPGRRGKVSARFGRPLEEVEEVVDLVGRRQVADRSRRRRRRRAGR